MASNMVRRFGFSDLIGPVSHSNESDTTTSPATQAAIESEIRTLIEAAQARATALLQDKAVELERLARALVEHETLNLSEVKRGSSPSLLCQCRAWLMLRYSHCGREDHQDCDGLMNHYRRALRFPYKCPFIRLQMSKSSILSRCVSERYYIAKQVTNALGINDVDTLKVLLLLHCA